MMTVKRCLSLRRDILILGSEVVLWSNEYVTCLAPGVSLISQEDWKLLVGNPGNESFSPDELAYIASNGWSVIDYLAV